MLSIDILKQGKEPKVKFTKEVLLVTHPIHNEDATSIDIFKHLMLTEEVQMIELVKTPCGKGGFFYKVFKLLYSEKGEKLIEKKFDKKLPLFVVPTLSEDDKLTVVKDGPHNEKLLINDMHVVTTNNTKYIFSLAHFLAHTFNLKQVNFDISDRKIVLLFIHEDRLEPIKDYAIGRHQKVSGLIDHARKGDYNQIPDTKVLYCVQSKTSAYLFSESDIHKIEQYSGSLDAWTVNWQDNKGNRKVQNFESEEDVRLFITGLAKEKCDTNLIDVFPPFTNIPGKDFLN